MFYLAVQDVHCCSPLPFTPDWEANVFDQYLGFDLVSLAKLPELVRGKCFQSKDIVCSQTKKKIILHFDAERMYTWH